MVTVPTLSPDRQLVITATDSTILMGTVPEMWGTPETVWLDKMGISTPKRMSVSMFLGHVFEPHILTAYLAKIRGEQAYGWDASLPGFQRMEDKPFGCTPDAFISNILGTVEYGFEAKSTTTLEDWGPEGTEEIPDRVYVQVQHSMMVTGKNRWDVGVFHYDKERKEELACLIMEHGEVESLDEFVRERRFYTIQRNDTVIDQIRKVGEAFWETHVVPRVRPNRGQEEPLYIPPEHEPIEDASFHERILALETFRSAAKESSAEAEKIAAGLKADFERLGVAKVHAVNRSLIMAPIWRSAAPDMKLCFEAACNLGNLSPSDRTMILTNYMKPASVSYRLDIKVDK